GSCESRVGGGGAGGGQAALPTSARRGIGFERMPPARIVLVEDNEGFRDALELLLGMRDDVEVVASVGDGLAAVAAAKEHRPDVVLMDYRMPALDGIQATAQIGQEVAGGAGV